MRKKAIKTVTASIIEIAQKNSSFLAKTKQIRHTGNMRKHVYKSDVRALKFEKGVSEIAKKYFLIEDSIPITMA